MHSETLGWLCDSDGGHSVSEPAAAPNTAAGDNTRTPPPPIQLETGGPATHTRRRSTPYTAALARSAMSTIAFAAFAASAAGIDNGLDQLPAMGWSALYGKPVPLPCVSAAFVSKKVLFLADFQGRRSARSTRRLSRARRKGSTPLACWPLVTIGSTS